MCVRYVLYRSDAALASISRALACRLAPPEWAKPRYNVTVTDVMPVVAASPAGPEVRGMMWGCVPPHERSKPKMRMWPNAKAETAPATGLWKAGAARRRCLVPADGFYEWQTVGRLKRPYYFTLRGEEPFAFAGLWEEAEGNVPETFAILTTCPNSLVASIHHRMPVILTPGAMPRWLGSEPLPEEDYRALIQPLPAHHMAARPVDPYVNRCGNEGPRCLAPAGESQPEFALGDWHPNVSPKRHSDPSL
ncbi:MAG: SOS response-associated peptidase [Opitutaceae bacterium]